MLFLYHIPCYVFVIMEAINHNRSFHLRVSCLVSSQHVYFLISCLFLVFYIFIFFTVQCLVFYAAVGMLRSIGQNKLATMASPVWQYLKVSEKDNKIAVCNVCVKQKPCSSARCDGPVSRATYVIMMLLLFVEAPVTEH